VVHLAIHPCGKPQGILAKANKFIGRKQKALKNAHNYLKLLTSNQNIPFPPMDIL